jgi:hypothetical protein
LSQPAVLPEQPSAPQPPPAYTSWENSPAAEDLRRRQEELERKAAELQRREQEIQRNLQFQGLKKLPFITGYSHKVKVVYRTESCTYFNFSVAHTMDLTFSFVCDERFNF